MKFLDNVQFSGDIISADNKSIDDIVTELEGTITEHSNDTDSHVSIEDKNKLLSIDNKMDKNNPIFEGVLQNLQNDAGLNIGEELEIFPYSIQKIGYRYIDVESTLCIKLLQGSFMGDNGLTGDYTKCASLHIYSGVDDTPGWDTGKAIADYINNNLVGKIIYLMNNTTKKYYQTKILKGYYNRMGGMYSIHANTYMIVEKTEEIIANVDSNGYIASLQPYYFRNLTTKVHFNYGRNNLISNQRNFILGDYNRAMGYQMVLGHYNSDKTTGSINGTSGDALYIGNGSSSSRSNALRVTYNGTIYATNSSISTGADYSEYFEWSDGNENDEDRVGYFVTFDSNKTIRKANSSDDYILGIVSGLPCIIGNGDEDWRGRYILDDFGRYIEESFEYEEVIKNEETGEEETITRTGTKFKENPDYNPNEQYIERAKRKEWSAIGMMGVLSVRDDGTCQENGYCTVADDGLATVCEYGDKKCYRVLERVNDNVVRVLFR